MQFVHSEGTEYDVSGRGNTEFGVFYAKGTYNSETAGLIVERTYCDGDDDNARSCEKGSQEEEDKGCCDWAQSVTAPHWWHAMLSGPVAIGSDISELVHRFVFGPVCPNLVDNMMKANPQQGLMLLFFLCNMPRCEHRARKSTRARRRPARACRVACLLRADLKTDLGSSTRNSCPRCVTTIGS